MSQIFWPLVLTHASDATRARNCAVDRMIAVIQPSVAIAKATQNVCCSAKISTPFRCPINLINETITKLAIAGMITLRTALTPWAWGKAAKVRTSPPETAFARVRAVKNPKTANAKTNTGSENKTSKNHITAAFLLRVTRPAQRQPCALTYKSPSKVRFATASCVPDSSGSDTRPYSANGPSGPAISSLTKKSVNPCKPGIPSKCAALM